MLTDGELLRRYLQNHSEDDFNELANRHLGLVYSSALRRLGGDTHLAEDAAQKVFFLLVRRASGLVDRKELASWLFTVTSYVTADMVRLERRRRAREARAQSASEMPPQSQVEVEWSRIRPLIDDAMDRLSAVDRQAVLLRFFQSQSLAQVGLVIGISEEAARKRVDRALDRLTGC